MSLLSCFSLPVSLPGCVRPAGDSNWFFSLWASQQWGISLVALPLPARRRDILIRSGINTERFFLRSLPPHSDSYPHTHTHIHPPCVTYTHTQHTRTHTHTTPHTHTQTTHTESTAFYSLWLILSVFGWVSFGMLIENVSETLNSISQLFSMRGKMRPPQAKKWKSEEDAGRTRAIPIPDFPGSSSDISFKKGVEIIGPLFAVHKGEYSIYCNI